MIFTDTYIDVPWGKLAVVCAGSPQDKPALFLHGMSDSAGGFVPLIERLPKGFFFIIPELPGCGKSTPYPPGGVLSTFDFIEPLRITVDHFELRDFIFVGHSMGVQIGLIYHFMHPGRIGRFLSLDSILYFPVEPEELHRWFALCYKQFYDPKNYQRFISPPSNGPLYTYQQAIESVKKSRGLTEEAAKAVLQRALVRAGDGHYRFCWEQRMKVIAQPHFSTQYQLEFYGGMNIPHLIVVADLSVDRLIKLINTKIVTKFVENNPGFRMDLVEGNHDVHINSPDKIASIVGPFLLGAEISKERTAEVVRALERRLQSDQPIKLLCKL